MRVIDGAEWSWSHYPNINRDLIDDIESAYITMRMIKEFMDKEEQAIKRKCT